MKWHAVGAVVLLVASLSAQGTDLMDVYLIARGNDPTFEAARLGFFAAQEKSPQALAANLPTLNLTGNSNHTDAKAAFNGSTPVRQGISAWTWTLQLTQPIMRPQNLLAYAESEQLVEAARANFEQAEQDMILRVAQAYFNVLIAQESVATAEAQLRAMEEQGVVASRGYKSGTLSVTDVYEAKSKAELSRAQLLAAKNDLTVKHAELKQLTGRRMEQLAELKPVAVIPIPAPDNADDWVSQAQDNNPLVRAQLFSLRAAGYTVTKAQAGNLWTLDFVASSGSNYSSGNVTMPVGYESRIKSNVMGLQFTMPIFAGGLNRSQPREAVFNKNKLSAQLEEARRKASADAEQAYAGILSGIAQTEALRAAIESGESSVKGNQAGYKLGIRINSDVLNAQQQLYASRRDLVKARYDTLLQGLKLKAAAGVLNESDVEMINGMLVK